MKYIVEIKPKYEDSFKGLMILGAKDSNLFVDALAVEDLEELNSDYINEHFSDLQDTAYQRGLEDGKEQNEKGCVGCMWEDKDYNTCSICCNSYKNMYEAKKADDEIKVGDELKQVTESGTETGLRCTVTAIDGDRMSGFSQDGRASVCSSLVNRWWKKTGRHFDIDKILGEMRK